MRKLVWLLVPLVGGCAWFKGAKDTIEGALEPIVAVGVVIQVDPPNAPELDDAELDLEIGRVGTIFLADARNVSDLGNTPVSGATLDAEGCGAVVQMGELASGTYVLEPGTELDTCAQPGMRIRRTDVDDALVAPITIPPDHDFALPRYHVAGQPITVRVSEAGYESALVVVVDAATGDVTFSNEPEGVVEYYQFLTGSGEVTDVEIPGEAFLPDTVHAVVVTGLVRTPNSELTEANTVLSVVSGGRGRVYAVSTLPDPTDL